ncbi:hypothetical protein O6P43_012123 [Quillaja saponaria]|uniref:Uncharacterized protein n=1 Tax=Quillaja saponaria TaxID=32244 RepID=A0AAD7M100_QUISA|nr:hypothetical protein O6P43_012123 [Quillaja saponaria]
MENMDSRIDSFIQELKADSEAKFQAMMELNNARFQEVLTAMSALQKDKENCHPPPYEGETPPILPSPPGLHFAHQQRVDPQTNQFVPPVREIPPVKEARQQEDQELKVERLSFA